MKALNISELVKVKLTEEGIRILENRHNNLLNQYSDKPEVRKTLGEFKMPEVDENGYSSFQLWELMNIFGSYMYNGNPKFPFETTIGIPDEYLVDLTTKQK